MKISRSLFLALTGAIAGASACHVYVDDQARVPPPPPPAPPSPMAYQYPARYPATYATSTTLAPNTGTSMTPTTASNPYGVRQISRLPVIRGRGKRVGVVTADPGYHPPPPTVASYSESLPGSATEGMPHPATEVGGKVAPVVTAAPAMTATPPGPASEGCLDTSAMATPDCSGLHVPATCGIRSFLVQRCEAYRKYMDAKVATVAIQCMEGAPPSQQCSATNAYDCGKQALSESCADNDLAQMCAIAASSCHTTASDCQALLSGLNDTGKAEVARCIGQGCKAGLYSCVEGLSSH
jgi:hypothetical protein